MDSHPAAGMGGRGGSVYGATGGPFPNQHAASGNGISRLHGPAQSGQEVHTCTAGGGRHAGDAARHSSLFQREAHAGARNRQTSVKRRSRGAADGGTRQHTGRGILRRRPRRCGILIVVGTLDSKKGNSCSYNQPWINFTRSSSPAWPTLCANNWKIPGQANSASKNGWG